MNLSELSIAVDLPHAIQSSFTKESSLFSFSKEEGTQCW